MLEEELGKIWSEQVPYSKVSVAERITVIQGWSGALADNDYNYWKSKGLTDTLKISRRQDYLEARHGLYLGKPCSYEYRIVDATAALIEQHLIEALSSPYPYIREWGRLVAQQDPSMKGTAEGCLVGEDAKILSGLV
jgi:hypothetical protein